MTRAAARPLALVGPEPTGGAGDRLDRVRTLLRPQFLAEVWDAHGRVFAPPRSHRLLGLRKCAVVDCEAGVRTPNTDLCKLCIEKFKVSGLATPRGTRSQLRPSSTRPARPFPTRRIRTASGGASSSIPSQDRPRRSMTLIRPRS